MIRKLDLLRWWNLCRYHRGIWKIVDYIGLLTCSIFLKVVGVKVAVVRVGTPLCMPSKDTSWNKRNEQMLKICIGGEHKRSRKNECKSSSNTKFWRKYFPKVVMSIVRYRVFFCYLIFIHYHYSDIFPQIKFLLLNAVNWKRPKITEKKNGRVNPDKNIFSMTNLPT